MLSQVEEIQAIERNWLASAAKARGPVDWARRKAYRAKRRVIRAFSAKSSVQQVAPHPAPQATNVPPPPRSIPPRKRSTTANMSKPRLLIPMSIQFSVRYILRTGLLDRLRDSAQPVVLLGWRDSELEAELQRAGAEVHHLIPARIGKNYDRVRSWMNFIQKKRLNTPSEMIWERRADLFRSPYTRFRRRARRQIFHAAFAIPGSLEYLHDKEEQLWRSDTNRLEVKAQVERLKPDAALSLTPYLGDEEMVLRVCEKRGIPLVTSILSFDNITTRGWWPVRFDRYLVWNRYNQAELLRGYPDIAPSSISIVGAPQFDFYWDPSFCWSESDWRRELNLPAGRPVILFGGGHFFCAPHEPVFLKQIDEAITSGEIPGNPVVLFRGHPVDKITAGMLR